MRDDLSALFRALVILYREKKSCLDKITSNEIQLRHLLRSDNTSALSDLLQQDNCIFTELSSIEFDIQEKMNQICKITGIEKDSFTKYFLSRDEEPVPELKKLKGDIDLQLSKLVSERDGLIAGIEKKMEEMKLDIEALKKIRTLDINRG